MADAITTHACVAQMGVGAEANPLVKFVIKKFGFTGLYAMKLALLAKMVDDLRGVDNYYDRERQFVMMGVWGWMPAANNIVVFRE